jgi:phage-related minor tail protein
MGWLSKAKDGFSKIFGKVKDVVQKFGKIYDKGKEIYGKGKEAVYSLPVVGNVAKQYVSQAEQQLGNKFQQVTGMTPSQFDERQKQVRSIIG